jgi:predicted N-acetyltransferase YhbS
MDEIPEMNCLALCELFVPTQLRGSGLGRLLLKTVEACALAQGYERVTLSPSRRCPRIAEKRDMRRRQSTD